MSNVLDDICLIGHPHASIGMSEQLLSHVSALQSIGVEPKVYDIYKYAKRQDERLVSQLQHSEVDKPVAETLIFHLNGDEVPAALRAMEKQDPDWRSKVKNTIMPAWELPRYPDEWCEGLKQFDGVLGISSFVSQALQESLGQPVPIVGQSVERHEAVSAYRRQFGIRESAYVFLAFFDLTSFSARKNPKAVLEFCDKLAGEAKYEDFQICLKMKSGGGAVAKDAISKYLPESINDHIVMINENLDRFSQTNLLACCDAYLSLHRSEGFGRGIGEAMGLRKPVLATNWSGAVDLLQDRSCFPIRYDLVDIGAGEYPFGEGQYWADPDVNHAVEIGLKLLRNRKLGTQVGDRARKFAQQNFFDFPISQKLDIGLREILNG
jgi:glycosyltransferase involved in cell wall biosynthesis